jgi:YHS domain-containing protein
MTIENPRDISVSVLVVGLGLLVGIAGPAAAGADAPVPAVNAQEGIGLKGYDPIAYFINRAPTQGSEQYSYVWKGTTYRFASEENLQRFKADPEKYLPQYGGYCAYAISIGRIADIDPSRWAIVNRKLYLNNNFFSQSLWSLNKSARIISGDRNWLAYPKTTQAN